MRVARSAFSQNWLERLTWFLLPYFCVTDALTGLDFEAPLTHETSFMVGLVSWNSPPFLGALAKEAPKNASKLGLLDLLFLKTGLKDCHGSFCRTFVSLMRSLD